MKKFSEIVYNKSLEDILCEHFKISYHMISYSSNRIILEDAGLYKNISQIIKYILDEIKKNLGKSQLISIMSQYTPFGKNLPDELYRTVTREEYEKVTSYALLIGLKHGYFQEGSAAKESFIPDFDS